MTWLNKAKVETRFERGRLLTPDGDQILVGAEESLVLIYQADSSLWENSTKDSAGTWASRAKTSSSWSNKTKNVL